MNNIFSAINLHATKHPNQIAIIDDHQQLNYAALQQAIINVLPKLNVSSTRETVAIDLENAADWAVIDVALEHLQAPSLPIPSFFSNEQRLHALMNGGATLLITDQPERYQTLLGSDIKSMQQLTITGKTLSYLVLSMTKQRLPDQTAKITYTSGTTGTPKGVCLSSATMLEVANSIIEITQIDASNTHLSVLPLATLLENIAGLYANLIVGATTYLLSADQIGFNGSQFNINQLMETLAETQANTLILMPGMLAQFVSTIEAGASPSPNLKFVAVGGASVAPELLSRANALGLPVFEGYGLSESNSVVALNSYETTKIGSVGKPLPHLKVRVSEDNEIMVKGANYLGYVGHDTHNEEWLATGDIGYLDDDGYVFINGRKKNMFITAYGRNVSPEWVERDLTNAPHILQACVYGEAKPWNIAIIVALAHTPSEQIDQSIATVNQQLPDYARIQTWIRADEPFSVNNQQLTPNGRLKRETILSHYLPMISACYARDALTM